MMEKNSADCAGNVIENLYIYKRNVAHECDPECEETADSAT
jgi:hypothetical protein